MKLYKVINLETPNKEVHEYTIIVDKNKNNHEETTLIRSYDSTWSSDRRGEEVIKLIDTGDQIMFPKKMFAGDADYALFAELHILMSFMSKTWTFPIYKGRIEEIVEAKTFDI